MDIETLQKKLEEIEDLECDSTDRAAELDSLLEQVRRLLEHLQEVGTCTL